MAEAIVLDPSEVADSRTELTLHPATGHGPIMVREEGPDWGDAEIAAYMAEHALGEVPVDFRLPNRRITVPLLVQSSGATSFDTARMQLQQKIGLFQREGGWLKRQMADGRELFMDVVNASLKMGGGRHQALHGVDDAVSVVFEAVPDFYEAEIALDPVSETTLPELVAVLKQGGVNAVIRGDHPGRVRIVVDELDADDQLGLLGAFRSRHYSGAATAALRYEAEALDPLDAAAVATAAGAAGASGGGSNNIVQHTNLGTAWTGVLGTNIGGTTFLTHVGTYRLWVRLRSPDGDAVQARFVYDVGDLVIPTENAPFRVPGVSTAFYWADLGEVRLDRVPVGTHRWQGQIQAKGDAGGEDIQIDRIALQPLDEAAWKVAVAAGSVEGLTDTVGRDEFTGTTAGGALGGRAAPVGTWATSGATTDFGFADAPDAGETVSRATTADASARQGVLGGALTNVEVWADVEATSLPASATWEMAAIVRRVDASNYLRAGIHGDPSNERFKVVKVVAGVATTLSTTSFLSDLVITTNHRYRIKLVAYASGRWSAVLEDESGAELAALGGSDSALATGGALASGAGGIHDRNNSGSAMTRYYDNVLVRSVIADAVVYANQSAEHRTDGIFREDAPGAAYGKLVADGDLPRIPVSGLEGRPVELFLKGSRGDFGQIPDSGIDDVRAQVFYRPSWMFVPAAA